MNLQAATVKVTYLHSITESVCCVIYRLITAIVYKDVLARLH